MTEIIIDKEELKHWRDELLVIQGFMLANDKVLTHMEKITEYFKNKIEEI